MRGPARIRTGDQSGRCSALEGGDLAGQRRLLVGGVVLVDDALADGLVELAAAARWAAVAFSTSPAATASRALRIAVLSEDLTALLRRRAFSLVLIRLIWDLMFATKEPFQVRQLMRSAPLPLGRTSSAEGTRHSWPRLPAALGRPPKPGAAPAVGPWRLRIDPTRALADTRQTSRIRTLRARDPYQRAGAEPYRPGADPQLLHHRAHRPRQVDARRPDAPAHRRGRAAADACPVPRPHGHRARARHHDQVPGGPAALGAHRGRAARARPTS